jgi:hypothetical protein
VLEGKCVEEGRRGEVAADGRRREDIEDEMCGERRK